MYTLIGSDSLLFFFFLPPPPPIYEWQFLFLQDWVLNSPAREARYLLPSMSYSIRTIYCLAWGYYDRFLCFCGLAPWSMSHLMNVWQTWVAICRLDLDEKEVLLGELFPLDVIWFRAFQFRTVSLQPWLNDGSISNNSWSKAEVFLISRAWVSFRGWEYCATTLTEMLFPISLIWGHYRQS